MSTYYGFIRLAGNSSWGFPPNTMFRMGLNLVNGICAFEGLSAEDVMTLVNGTEQDISFSAPVGISSMVSQAFTSFRRDIEEGFCYAVGWSSYGASSCALMAFRDDLSKAEVAAIVGEYALTENPQV